MFLFVVLVVLLLASSCSVFFVIVVFLLLGPLRVDFGCPRGPSDPQKPSSRLGGSSIFEKSTSSIRRSSAERLGALVGFFLALLGVSWGAPGLLWGALGGLLGASREPRDHLGLLLELS